MNSKTLDLYIASIDHDFSHAAFEFENDKRNPIYWEKQHKALVHFIKEDLQKHKFLKKFPEFINDFDKNIDFFTFSLLLLYEKIFTYSVENKPKTYLNSINITLIEVRQNLKNFRWIKGFLLHTKMNDAANAKKIEDLIQFYFQKMNDSLEYLGVYFQLSPLGEDYNALIESIKGITSFEDVRISNIEKNNNDLKKNEKDFKTKHPINNEFLEYISDFPAILYWRFDTEENIEIVQTKFTHEFLLENNSIGNNILKYYYLPTNINFSDKTNIRNSESDSTIKIHKSLRPYPFIIYGAYHNRVDLYSNLNYIKQLDNKPYLGKRNDLHSLEDFQPYFKDYASGFKEGYNNFENDIINPYLTEFADKHDYIYKVHEFITKKLIFKHDWLHRKNGFTIANLESKEGGTIINAFDDGQKQGYFYRAWTIVFSNSHLFESLFETTIKEKLGIDKNSITENISETQNKDNPYPQIFPDKFSFKLFERLHSNYKDSHTLLADYSFIYRKMYSLNHILEHLKPEMFRNWLSKEPYSIIIGSKFKTLNRCSTDEKESNFNIVFELVSKEYDNVP